VNYLIDTNIISEVRKGDRCDPNVAAWYASIDDADIYLSVLATSVRSSSVFEPMMRISLGRQIASGVAHPAAKCETGKEQADVREAGFPQDRFVLLWREDG
jgi:hypothetical protein